MPATQATIQTQANWGAVERVANAKRVTRLAQTSVDDDSLTAWLIEAAVRYAGKPVSVTSLQSLPVPFPLAFMRPLAYPVSKSPSRALHSEGQSNQFVSVGADI